MAKDREYEVHELAAIFPMMSDDQLTELAEDIRENGLNNPGVLFQGKILDGRNRYEACKRAGLRMGWTTLSSGTDPLAFVISQNLRRRDLTTSQRAMVAGRMANLENGSNQYAQKSGVEVHQCTSTTKTGGSEQPDQGGGVGVHQCTPTTKLGKATPPDSGSFVDSVSASAAAEVCGVARRTVFLARLVDRDGADELIEAVESGEIPVKLAAELVQLEQRVTHQRELVKRGKQAVADAVKRLQDDEQAKERATEKAKGEVKSTSRSAQNGNASAHRPQTTAQSSGEGEADRDSADLPVSPSENVGETAETDETDRDSADLPVSPSENVGETAETDETVRKIHKTGGSKATGQDDPQVGSQVESGATGSNAKGGKGPIKLKADELYVVFPYSTELPQMPRTDPEKMTYTQRKKLPSRTSSFLFPILYRDESIARAYDGALFETQKDKHGVYVHDASPKEKYTDVNGKLLPRRLWPLRRASHRRAFYWLSMIRHGRTSEAIYHIAALGEELGDPKLVKLSEDIRHCISEHMRGVMKKLIDMVEDYEKGITVENYPNYRLEREDWSIDREDDVA